jgi:hypothetical protein
MIQTRRVPAARRLGAPIIHSQPCDHLNFDGDGERGPSTLIEWISELMVRRICDVFVLLADVLLRESSIRGGW